MSYRTLDMDELATLEDDLIYRRDADPEDEAEPLTDDDFAMIETLAEIANNIGTDSIRDYVNDYGSTAINANDFREYAMEFAEETGAVPINVSWPMDCIDWTAAANELAMDYSEFEWNGYEWMVARW